MFKELKPDEKNLMMWAALLHDIRKQGLPKFEGKDHIHPFQSSLSVLRFLKKFKIIDCSNNEVKKIYDEIKRLIKDSTETLDEKAIRENKENLSKVKKYNVEHVCEHVHSHRHLKRIYELLWNKDFCPRSSFGDLIFRLVMFH